MTHKLVHKENIFYIWNSPKSYHCIAIVIEIHLVFHVDKGQNNIIMIFFGFFAESNTTSFQVSSQVECVKVNNDCGDQIRDRATVAIILFRVPSTWFVLSNFHTLGKCRECVIRAKTLSSCRKIEKSIYTLRVWTIEYVQSDFRFSLDPVTAGVINAFLLHLGRQNVAVLVFIYLKENLLAILLT